jgi:hypothetical protein
MPATVIPVKGLLLGFVGNISHEGYSLRSSRIVRAADTLSVAFGEAVTINTDNSYSSIKSFIAGSGTVTASTPLALAASNVNINPTYNVVGSQGVNMGGGLYRPGDVMDALVQGTMNVSCNNGTPVAGGTVYIRVALNGAIPAGIVGGLEATTDGANVVALTNLKWKTGYLETDLTAEVTILARTIA